MLSFSRTSVGQASNHLRASRALASGPVLRLRKEDPEARFDFEEVQFKFRNTPRTEVRKLNSAQDLNVLLSTEAARAAASSNMWARQGWTQWVGHLFGDLSLEDQTHLVSKHGGERFTTVSEALASDQSLQRWTDSAQFADGVIKHWMHGKRFKEVLAMSEELGQLDMPAGYVLEGDFVQDVAASEDVTFNKLVPMLQGMSGVDKWVSLTRVQSNNCFLRMPCDGRLSHLQPIEGQGSLNTSCRLSDGESSGVDLLDEYHQQIRGTTRTNLSVDLNPHMYLIWKFPHYVTEYHQDTHQMPHLTLYNQVSGVSTFHFLPVLAGLFASHVGKQRGMKDLAELLSRFDERGIGSVASLSPGQMAMILPFASHGVYVPSPSLNPDMPAFEVSMIRAAELYLKEVQGICEQRGLQGSVPVCFMSSPQALSPNPAMLNEAAVAAIA